MTSEHYDIVVIGAGINGAGVAQLAAAKGYKVLVIEKNRAAGLETSSRSSKLVHGGLRYLETFEFSLVRESLQQRNQLLKLAPELVHLTKFNIPIYKDTNRTTLKLHAGLSLYAILAGLHSDYFYRQLKQGEWDKLEGLSTQDLKTVFQYQDAQTDDQALTRSVIFSAENMGAEIIYQSEMTSANITSEQVEISIHQNNINKTITSHVLVNASGPWSFEVLKKISQAGMYNKPDLVQGAHLVINKSIKQAYYLEAPQDGRVVFLLPWKQQALLGTTEKQFQGDPSQVKTTDEEREYLLEVYHHYFPLNDVTITEEMAGCRVLPAAGENLFKRSRETVFELNDHNRPRLVTIQGGKLTVFRDTADKVMKLLSPSLPYRKTVADTDSIMLHPVD